MNFNIGGFEIKRYNRESKNRFIFHVWEDSNTPTHILIEQLIIIILYFYRYHSKFPIIQIKIMLYTMISKVSFFCYKKVSFF